MILEMAVVHMLTHKAEMLKDMKKKTLKELDKIQLKFLGLALGVGTGCPIPFLYSETGPMLMSNKVIYKKMFYLHHVAIFPLTPWPGRCMSGSTNRSTAALVLSRNVSHFLVSLGNGHDSYTENHFKKFLKQKMFIRNKQNIVTNCVAVSVLTAFKA